LIAQSDLLYSGQNSNKESYQFDFKFAQTTLCLLRTVGHKEMIYEQKHQPQNTEFNTYRKF
jgi:hypothetical protein